MEQYKDLYEIGLDLEENDEKASKSECTSRTLSEYEKSFAYKCCFSKGTCQDEDGDKETYKGCTLVTREMYDNIKKYVDEGKKEGCKDITIDCKSSFFNLALTSLIIIIFL